MTEGCVEKKGNECVELGHFMRLCQAAADDDLERSSLTRPKSDIASTIAYFVCVTQNSGERNKGNTFRSG